MTWQPLDSPKEETPCCDEPDPYRYRHESDGEVEVGYYRCRECGETWEVEV